MGKLKQLFVSMVLLTMLISGCSLPGLGGPSKDTIRIGTLNTSESQIMGQVLKQLIEHHTDAKVSMINNLGSDRKSTRLNSSHVSISYAVFCLKKKNNIE